MHIGKIHAQDKPQKSEFKCKSVKIQFANASLVSCLGFFPTYIEQRLTTSHESGYMIPVI